MQVITCVCLCALTCQEHNDFFQYGSYSCSWIFPISLTVFFRNTNYLYTYSLVFNIRIFCIYVRSQTAPWNPPVSGLCSKPFQGWALPLDLLDTLSSFAVKSFSHIPYGFFLHSFFYLWTSGNLFIFGICQKNRRVEVPLAPFYLLDSWDVHSIWSSPGSQHDFP